MRIHDELLNPTVFLGGRDDAGALHYRATAFCISMDGPTDWRTAFPCLVTAKHNIDKALKSYGNIFVRVNTFSGDAIDVEVTEPWSYADGCDLAAIPFPHRSLAVGSMILPMPFSWAVTEELIANRGIGPGEELVVVGLFSNHVGRKRNLPIVRCGSIASMPSEPLRDIHTGETYDAYLAEVRSIGGLSGSPVFVVLNPATRLSLVESHNNEIGQHFYLLGLIRGHWNTDAEADFGEDYLDSEERELLNTGIAIVTPISELSPLFKTERFVRYKARMETMMNSDSEQVKDWSEDEPDSFDRFGELTDKLLRVPKKELDEKREAED